MAALDNNHHTTTKKEIMKQFKDSLHNEWLLVPTPPCLLNATYDPID